MKKVIIYIIGIILCLITSDIVIGYCCKYYIKNHQLTGRYHPLDKLIKEVDTDIILIGNSAILNSLNPEIIEDSLSMTCYNGGITGQGVFFFETIIDCILQRHTPKMIIVGLRPEEVGGSIGEGIYDVLKPYYGMGYRSIDDHFNKTSGFNRLLLHSNLLRYNTIWVRVLLYMLLDNTTYPENGFMPMGKPSKTPQLHHIERYEEPVKAKLDCIERIIQKCEARDIDIAICFPPTLSSFKQDNIPCVNTVEEICRLYNTPCFIDYNNKYYLSHPELFYDPGHVNKIGADLYTKNISKQLQHIYGKTKTIFY
jgi:hypothetical protein